MDFKLENKTALITGSSRGIGLQIARTLQKQGCKVVLNSRESASLNKSANQLKGSISIAGDVTNPDEAKKIADETIKILGSLDILVCNVGSGKSVSPGHENFAEWKKMMDINFFSTTNMVEASKDYLSKTKGKIICISSICGNETIPGAPITYSCAKSALNAYVKGISRFLAKKNIRINAIAPGNILFNGSTWDKKIIDNPIFVQEMLTKEVPLGCFGSPEDIACLVCYLASPLSSFMTGSILTLDGGQIRS